MENMIIKNALQMNLLILEISLIKTSSTLSTLMVWFAIFCKIIQFKYYKTFLGKTSGCHLKKSAEFIFISRVIFRLSFQIKIQGQNQDSKFRFRIQGKNPCLDPGSKFFNQSKSYNKKYLLLCFQFSQGTHCF